MHGRRKWILCTTTAITKTTGKYTAQFFRLKGSFWKTPLRFILHLEHVGHYHYTTKWGDIKLTKMCCNVNIILSLLSSFSRLLIAICCLSLTFYPNAGNEISSRSRINFSSSGRSLLSVKSWFKSGISAVRTSQFSVSLPEDLKLAESLILLYGLFLKHWQLVRGSVAVKWRGQSRFWCH